MTYLDVANVVIGQLADDVFYNQILANIRACYNPPTATLPLNVGTDPTTVSTIFVDITGVSVTLTLDAQSDVLILFHGAVSLSAGNPGYVFF